VSILTTAVPLQSLSLKHFTASQSRLDLILLAVSCNVSCLEHLNDVSISSCLSLILNVLAHLVSRYLCLGKCLCLRKKMSRLNHWQSPTQSSNVTYAALCMCADMHHALKAGMLTRPRVTRPRPRPETARPRPRPKCQGQGQGRTRICATFFSL